MREPRPRSLPPEYEHMGRVGSGGMADVYLVRHRALQIDRALKVIRQRSSVDVQRFTREAQIAARLGAEHRHIIDVYDHGELPTGEPYAVLPYFARGSLEAQTGPPRTRKGQAAMCSILADVASALRCLADQHPQPFVHRDLKPHNILIGEENGTAYGVLADFGLARAIDDATITHGGPRLFTPVYAAPEQIRGEQLDPSADVYALGVTVCQTLSGRLPFDAAGRQAWMNAHLRDEPRVPTPTDARLLAVRQLIERSLAKDPFSRPDAAAWEQTLREAQRALLAGRAG